MVKLGMFVLISVSLTAVLFMINMAMGEIGNEIGDGNVNSLYFNYDESNIKSFDSGNYTLDGSIEDTINSLPSGENTNDVDEAGNIFTDTFRSIKEWLLQSIGIKYILSVLNALPSFISRLFPDEFRALAFGIGYLWHTLTIFALIFWIKGGGQ